MRKIEIAGFSRISKAAARKLYNAGQIVYFCAVNMRPGAPLNPECGVQLDPADPEPFENRVNAFEFYNCADCETGKYTAFYVKGV